MALNSGTRLGVYEVAAQIGEGGMGQVYRATDTKLKRQVAIKILPASVAADHDRLMRFQREAEVLASLNHPNIAAIYGIEESGGTTALVMELVEGEDLSAIIARGPLSPADALPKHSAFSPDGRWLAYTSASPGTADPGVKVFVQPVPSTGALYQVSTGQGRTPVWSHDGSEFFYHEPVGNQLMVVKVRLTSGIEFSAPVALPIKGTIHPFAQRNFDVTPDGRQLLVVLPADADENNGNSGSTARIRVVENWFEEVKRLVPVR